VAEGRPDELGTPTFPSRRFVTSGGLTVVHEGLLEYELIDIDSHGDDHGDGSGGGAAARTLALTLLRATGMLSRMGMVTRPLPAGPTTPIEGPQLLGPISDVLVPLATTASFGGGDRPDRGSALTVVGGQVSSVRRQAGQLEVRVFNPGSRATRIELPGRSGWLIDLRGRPLTPFEGGFELRAHGIATARLAGG
jgi:hypothetical protein